MRAFIFIHVILSLIGIFSGMIVLIGMLIGKRLNRLTFVFLGSTLATSVTGFCFLPFDGFTPAQAFGVLSTILLAQAIYGRYARHLEGNWRNVYVITAVAALYLNAFVGIVQAFRKIAFLNAIDPTQSAAPFVSAQAINFILFVIVGFLAVRGFAGEAERPLSAGELSF